MCGVQIQLLFTPRRKFRVSSTSSGAKRGKKKLFRGFEISENVVYFFIMKLKIVEIFLNITYKKKKWKNSSENVDISSRNLILYLR